MRTQEELDASQRAIDAYNRQTDRIEKDLRDGLFRCLGEELLFGALLQLHEGVVLLVASCCGSRAPLLSALYAASVRGRTATGPRTGQRTLR